MPWFDKYKQVADNVSINIPISKGVSLVTNNSPYTEDQFLNLMEGVHSKTQYDKNQKQNRISQRKNAEQTINNNQPFTLPSGKTKKFSDMDFREKRYVEGAALENRGRIFPNEESIIDDLNPLNWIASMAGNMSKAPYEAKQQDSYIPYLTSVGTPLAVGALGSIGAKTTGQFVNNITNPFAGIDVLNSFDKGINFYKKDWLKGYKEIPKLNNKITNFVDPEFLPTPQKAAVPNPFAIADAIIPRPLSPGNFFGVEDSWNNYSPLNLIPGYGKKLIDKTSEYPNFVGFRKFGNSIDDVVKSKTLRPRGSGLGSKQIQHEGNWAEPGKVNENYRGVFEATMNPQVPGSNIKLEKWNKRNGVVGTTKEGNVEIPITDPGLSFNRRLPFSNRYVPIDKNKLINNQFQFATFAPHLQSLSEKYAIWSGIAAGASLAGFPEMQNLNKKYIIDPIVQNSNKIDSTVYNWLDKYKK